MNLRSSRGVQVRLLAAALGAAILAGGCTGGDDGEALRAEDLSSSTVDIAGSDQAVGESESTAGSEELETDATDLQQDAQGETGGPADRSGEATNEDGEPGGSNSALLGGKGDDEEQPSNVIADVGSILDETGEGLTGPELEAYLAHRFKAYWQVFDAARQAPTGDPEHEYPALANLAGGELLESSHSQIRDLFQAGEAIRDADVAAVPGLDADSVHRVRIESVNEGVAELETCLVNDRIRYAIDSGAVVGGSVISVRARSTMAKADGTWKIIRSEAVAIDQGVGGCWNDDDYTH